MEGIIQWSPGMTLESMEKQIILAAFRHYRANKTTTAAALGISVRTLDAKLGQYKEDSVKEKDADYARRERQAAFLTRSRGPAGGASIESSVAAATAASEKAKAARPAAVVPGPNAGVRVESTGSAPAQQAVPVSVGSKVQSVLPPAAAQSGSAKGR